ncbi:MULTISPECIES: CaiB/BaiF CoA transferase family protein [unclassified Xanthobacter]|uniref:CaiB/BaiF CoA transferase family protein n=1 Tax=unclassified Xanthobacter TaxID=2623496 RepID=UPI001EE0D4CA|nr:MULTISPECIES: CaiB/BaiF CoA-transferase family protein [unclassified Xanthobacter]
MSGPLAGLRIIEMVGLGPAPFAAMMLADAGAEVIRIHQKGQRPEIPLMNTRFDVLARGRRSIALDLKVEADTAVMLELIARADGLIEGFRPGVMERLGLGPDVCLARNPRLAYGRMTGWGQEGPLADTAGHDLNYLGVTGALAALGPADAPPPVPLNLVADFGGGGMLMAFGLLAAIHHARASGRGQVVDAAMTDGASLLAAMFWGFRAGGLWGTERATNLLDGGAYFYATYACADGKFLAVAPVEKKFHQILIDTLGLEADAFTHVADPGAWGALRTRLADIFRSQPRAHWAALFAGTDACVTPILDWDEATAQPQAQARSAFVDVDGVTQPAPAPRFSATPSAITQSAAAPGAHGAQILAEWGIPSPQPDGCCP